MSIYYNILQSYKYFCIYYISIRNLNLYIYVLPKGLKDCEIFLIYSPGNTVNIPFFAQAQSARSHGSVRHPCDSTVFSMKIHGGFICQNGDVIWCHDFFLSIETNQLYPTSTIHTFVFVKPALFKWGFDGDATVDGEYNLITCGKSNARNHFLSKQSNKFSKRLDFHMYNFTSKNRGFTV